MSKTGPGPQDAEGIRIYDAVPWKWPDPEYVPMRDRIPRRPAPDDLIALLRARLDETATGADQVHDLGCSAIPSVITLDSGPCDCGQPVQMQRRIAAARAIADLYAQTLAIVEHAESRPDVPPGPDYMDARREAAVLRVVVERLTAGYS